MHPDWQNKVHLYSEDHSTPEPIHLQKVTEFTWKKMINPRQLSGHLQGRLLANLVAVKNPKCILEIGSFTGYSTACLAENINEDAFIYSIEADAETAFKTQQFWKDYPFMNRVNWQVGPALEVIPKLNILPDFIFVDADKKNYKNYLDLCLPILQKNGIILFDNTCGVERSSTKTNKKTTPTLKTCMSLISTWHQKRIFLQFFYHLGMD